MSATPHGEPGGEPLGEAVDEDDAVGGVRHERRRGVRGKEPPDGVLDGVQAQPVEGVREFGPAAVRHRDAERIVQGGLGVERVQRGGAVQFGEGGGQQPVLVGGDGDEGDPEPCGERLDHGVSERFHGETAAGRDERGEGGGDGLAAVAREEQPAGVGTRSAAGEQFGEGLACARGTRGGERAQRGAEDIGALQRGEPRGEQLRLAFDDGVVELQVDPLGCLPARAGPSAGGAARTKVPRPTSPTTRPRRASSA